MVDRRAFIQSSFALPAAVSGLAFSPGGAAATERFRTLALERFVYDARFAEGFDVAQHVGKLGVELSPISDDLMTLWYDDLDLRWKEAPMALGGVTLAEALFVLETLAADRQMRVVYRGEHAPAEDGMIRHKLAGPRALVEGLAAQPPEADWEAALARAVTACPLGEPETAEAELVTAAPAIVLRDETIYSWIIAPRSTVRLKNGV